MNTSFKKIPVFDFVIGEKEKELINDCLEKSMIGQGFYVKEFEKKFSKFVECDYGTTTTSGTTALHLACKTIGLQNNDQVLVSSSTNMASAFAIDYCGAIPIPIDVEKETWQMDVNKIEEKINKNTKAIMVVHLFGHPVDMDPVLKIAKKFNLKIIEDCAEVHGVEYKGKKLGSIGDIAAFSFFANKTITCGEGGMVVTNNKELALKVGSPKAIRAVATIVGQNPNPILVPCHRVIRSDGKVGEYTYKGKSNQRMKIKLTTLLWEKQ
jgi:perosamine synthetase